MSQRIQGAHALSAGDVCEKKKKRGRPRKNPVPVQNKPAVETAKKRGKKTVACASCGNENGVAGQAVTGVIDGAFDAGYLLTVRVGDSNTLLRGIVFRPGRYVPVNPQNDVAPGFVTYQRNWLSLPNLNRMPYGPFRPRYEEYRLRNPRRDVPEVPVPQPQAEESAEVAEEGEVMPSAVEATEELKVGPAPTPVIEVVANESEPENRAPVSSNPSNVLVRDQVKTPYLELNEPPPVSEAELMEFEPNSEVVDSPVEVSNGEGKARVDAISAVTEGEAASGDSAGMEFDN